MTKKLVCCTTHIELVESTSKGEFSEEKKNRDLELGNDGRIHFTEKNKIKILKRKTCMHPLYRDLELGNDGRIHFIS